MKGYVWAWPDGKPHRPDYLYHEFKKVMKRLGLPEMRVHDLRHSHATFLLLKKVDIKVVAAQLGHASADFARKTYSISSPRCSRRSSTP